MDLAIDHAAKFEFDASGDQFDEGFEEREAKGYQTCTIAIGFKVK